MPTKLLLGELLIEQGLVESNTINEALRVQVSGNRRLGNILVRMGALTEDQLVDALARQLDIEIIDINKIVSGDAPTKLPRYVCNKYDVLPLRLKDNNILEIAMTDPSDQQAIDDLEQFTGNVVEPRLARQSEIEAGIKKYVPYSLKDFFSPESSTRFTRIAVAVCLVLIVAIGGMTYRYIHDSTYGTLTETVDATIYKNHDLMLGFDKSGKISFLGRGAFAKGFYSATFNDTAVLHSFIESRNADLSDKQKKWLDWAVSQVESRQREQSVASTK